MKADTVGGCALRTRMTPQSSGTRTRTERTTTALRAVNPRTPRKASRSALEQVPPSISMAYRWLRSPVPTGSCVEVCKETGARGQFGGSGAWGSQGQVVRSVAFGFLVRALRCHAYKMVALSALRIYSRESGTAERAIYVFSAQRHVRRRVRLLVRALRSTVCKMVALSAFQLRGVWMYGERWWCVGRSLLFLEWLKERRVRLLQDLLYTDNSTGWLRSPACIDTNSAANIEAVDAAGARVYRPTMRRYGYEATTTQGVAFGLWWCPGISLELDGCALRE